MKKRVNRLVLPAVFLLVPLLMIHNSLKAETGIPATQQYIPKPFVIPLPYKKGNAQAEDVLTGKTFTNKEAVNLSGSMANVGQQNITPGVTGQGIDQGYHNGTGVVLGDGDLLPENIRLGKEIFTVQGNVGLAWGCTPGSGTWDEAVCTTACKDALNGAYDFVCAELCLKINNAFEGFVVNLGVVVHKNWICKGE